MCWRHCIPRCWWRTLALAGPGARLCRSAHSASRPHHCRTRGCQCRCALATGTAQWRWAAGTAGWMASTGGRRSLRRKRARGRWRAETGQATRCNDMQRHPALIRRLRTRTMDRITIDARCGCHLSVGPAQVVGAGPRRGHMPIREHDAALIHKKSSGIREACGGALKRARVFHAH